MYFAGPANDSLSFQQSDERWDNDIDCISQHNLPFLASTSSFGLARDRKTILSGRTVVPVLVWPTFFFWSQKAGLCLHRFLAFVSSFFFLFFCWENIGNKIRKIILKSAQRRSNDPQFERKGLATLWYNTAYLKNVQWSAVFLAQFLQFQMIVHRYQLSSLLNFGKAPADP